MIKPDFAKALEIDKFQALQNEMPIATNLIVHGIKDLLAIGPDNEFYFLPVFELSQGFERMFKLMLCFEYHDKHGDYPRSKAFLTRYNHKILELLDTVKAECFDYLDKEDLNFLNTDIVLNEILSLLDSFAKQDRYYNLNILTADKYVETFKSPDDLWKDMEGRLFKSCPDLQAIYTRYWNNEADIGEVYRKLNSVLFSRLYRFGLILFSFFINGPLKSKRRLHCQPAYYMRDSLVGFNKAFGIIL